MSGAKQRVWDVRLSLLFVFISALAIPSIHGENIQDLSNNDVVIHYFQREFSLVSRVPDNPSKRCASIDVSYPIFVYVSVPGMRDSFNNLMIRLIDSVANSKATGRLPDSIAQDFIRSEEQDSCIGGREGFSPWRGISIRIGLISHNILTLTCNLSWMNVAVVGSQGFSVNVNARTGKGLTLGDLLIEGFKTELDSLGEIAFRKVRKLSPEASLDSAGFRFSREREGFTLNDDFIVDSTGLHFFFDQGEIAGRYKGGTQITILYDQLLNIIKPDGPLAPIVNSRK